VAILCPRDKRSSPLAKDRSVGDVPITTDLEKWRAGSAVLFATVRSFKGLEADAIIMLDVPEPDTVPYFSRTDFYVGCSRAKHVLVVVSNK